MNKKTEEVIAFMNGRIGKEITSRKINDLEMIDFNVLVQFLIDGLTIIKKEKYSKIIIKRETFLKSISLFLKTFNPIFLQSDTDITIIAKESSLDYLAYAKEKSFSLFGIALNELYRQRPIKYLELENTNKVKIYDLTINKVSGEFKTSFKEVSFLLYLLINIRITNPNLSLEEAIEMTLNSLGAFKKEKELVK